MEKKKTDLILEERFAAGLDNMNLCYLLIGTELLQAKQKLLMVQISLMHFQFCVFRFYGYEIDFFYPHNARKIWLMFVTICRHLFFYTFYHIDIIFPFNCLLITYNIFQNLLLKFAWIYQQMHKHSQTNYHLVEKYIFSSFLSKNFQHYLVTFQGA